MNNEVEKLYIYRAYLDLIYYSYNIMKKFPKSERDVLNKEIRTVLIEGYKNIIYAYEEKKIDDKINYLRFISTNIKVLSFYIRLSYKEKYISLNNYEAWSRKLNIVNKHLNNWISVCLKKLK